GAGATAWWRERARPGPIPGPATPAALGQAASTIPIPVAAVMVLRAATSTLLRAALRQSLAASRGGPAAPLRPVLSTPPVPAVTHRARVTPALVTAPERRIAAV